MTLNDAILAATGGPTVNDGLRAYYNAQGVPYGALQDMERAFLRIQMPVAEGSNQDLWMQYLSGVWGYEGTLNDMLYQYWLAGASIGLSWQDMVDLYFSNGEQGVIYPLNPAEGCVFQDSAGATPCTGPDQPVGLALDVSGNGNHASQPTTTKRPMLGREPFGGRRNLLTYTEDFGNAVWGKNGVSITSWAGTSPSGSSDATRLIADSGTAADYYLQQIAQASGSSIYAKEDSARYLGISDGPYGLVAGFDLRDGTQTYAFDSSYDATITSEGNGWWRISLSPHGDRIRILPSTTVVTSSRTVTGNGVDGVLIWGAQKAITPTPYQKVVSSFDVTEAGVPDCWYIKGDGIDDCMYTGNIDFTGTDKMTVWAGLHKYNDTGSPTVFETSAGGESGSFYIRAPTGGQPNYELSSTGSVQGTFGYIFGVPAPDTAVITGAVDLAVGTHIWYEGVAGSGDTQIAGGSFGNYPLNLLSRGGTALFFYGNLYSLMIRGAETTDLAPGNEYTAALTGVTLP